MPTLSFPKLVAQLKHYHAIEDSNDPVSGYLTFNPEPNAPAKFGSFKKAFFGYTSHPVVGDRLYVCIKHCWYSGAPGSGQRMIYDNATQVSKLTSEMNCLRWASALMDLVYKFVEQNIEMIDPPQLIPDMRFVHAALCILDNRDTFMIEESIDDKFLKYIGNNSAVPFTFVNEDYNHRALFLAFCQHVQYIKTNGKAFIGDFQGTIIHLVEYPLILSLE
jgi:Alpha-kinase family